MWSTLRRSAAFWFGLTFLIATATMVPVVLTEKATYEALLAKGQSTEAAVIESGERKDADAKSTHWLKIQYYDLALKEYQSERTVSKAIWQKYPVGSTIAVRYLIENPETVKLVASLPTPEWKDLLAMTITFLVIGLAIVTLSAIKARRSHSAGKGRTASTVPVSLS